MTLSGWQVTGLRGRILLTVGLATSVVMMLLSWGMLYSWRNSLLAQERKNAMAVSRALSVAVIDAMIFADQGLYQSEGFLDNYVAMFMEQNARLRSLTILDAEGRTVARSWESEENPWVSGPLPRILATTAGRTLITRSKQGPWVLETVLPLRTGNRTWGVLVLALEAESIRAQVRHNFLQLALFSTSVTSILLFLLWLLLSRLLRSLQVLVTAMDTLDFNAPDVMPLPERRDEIGILFQHFRGMQGRLDQSRSDLLAAQKQVWHAERLASIGRLASGLAHEINNPINGVRNCIYAIRDDLDDRQQTEEYLTMMDEGLSGAALVVEKLLGFARKDHSEQGPVPLNDAVVSVQRLVAFNLEREGVVLDLDLDPALPAVRGDRQLFQEVIMNLLINAADASSRGDAIRVVSSADERFVRLSVQDHGHGVPDDIADQIFEPFFTTKQTGEGTGLGLSICLSIVQACGGDIGLESDPDSGTTFTITLPRADEESEEPDA